LQSGGMIWERAVLRGPLCRESIPDRGGNQRWRDPFCKLDHIFRRMNPREMGAGKTGSRGVHGE
jgi:hypothetical protein